MVLYRRRSFKTTVKIRPIAGSRRLKSKPCGIGTLVGLLLENVIFGFALGGVIGIILSFIYSYYTKVKKVIS